MERFRPELNRTYRMCEVEDFPIGQLLQIVDVSGGSKWIDKKEYLVGFIGEIVSIYPATLRIRGPREALDSIATSQGMASYGHRNEDSIEIQGALIVKAVEDPDGNY